MEKKEKWRKEKRRKEKSGGVTKNLGRTCSVAQTVVKNQLGLRNSNKLRHADIACERCPSSISYRTCWLPICTPSAME